MEDLPRDSTDLPQNLKEAIANELAAGEQLRWVSQPHPRSSFPWIALIPMCFGLFFTCFAIFWIVMAMGFVGNGAPMGGLFPLFGIPFVLVGLGMMSTPFWMKRRLHNAAQRTAYAITNQRAIIFDGGYFGDSTLANLVGGMSRALKAGMSVRSYTPDKLGQITRTQRDDGSGDVYFGEILYTTQTNQLRQIQRDGFFSVPQVKDVEEMIKALATPA